MKSEFQFKKIIIHAILFGLLFFILSLVNTNQKLQFTAQRIQEDITYQDGTWDTSSYNGDPILSGTSVIYILASDGFVIERWKPISGYLDASDFKHLLEFKEVQTIKTVSNQEWRILSVPIHNNGEMVGVVTVSSYHPLPEVLPTFDQQLREAANALLEHVEISQNDIALTGFDQRTFPYYISFQIVNKFNTIVAKGNNTNSIDRLPNFIDPSYVSTQLQRFPLAFVRDQKNGDIFFLLSNPLQDESGQTKGIIVVGENLAFLLQPFAAYFGIVVLVVSILVTQQNLTTWYRRSHSKIKTMKMSFNEKTSILSINDSEIPIPYASNQYFLTQAVLSRPKKRWEVDELLERLGEDPRQNSWRKIYDAMNQVNKKAYPVLGKKLILLEEKTYRLNSENVSNHS